MTTPTETRFRDDRHALNLAANEIQMLESSIERSIRVWCNQQGYHCLKLVNQSSLGWPDRTVLKPNGEVVFMEIKQPEGHRRRAQIDWIRKLHELGHRAGIVDSLESARDLIDA